MPYMLIAQQEKKMVIENLDLKYDHYSKIAQAMWENPELGFFEVNSSALLQKELENAGFTTSTIFYANSSPILISRY